MKAPNVPNWKGIQPALALTGAGVTPPASVSFLATGNDLALAVGLTYAQPALMFEGNTAASGTGRRISAVIGPAAQYARAFVTRCGTAVYSTPQAPATVITQSTGFWPTTFPSGLSGAETYLDTGSAPGVVAMTVSGDKVIATWSTGVDRALPVPEGLAPTVPAVDITNAAGFGLCVVFWSPDLEAI